MLMTGWNRKRMSGQRKTSLTRQCNCESVATPSLRSWKIGEFSTAVIGLVEESHIKLHWGFRVEAMWVRWEHWTWAWCEAQDQTGARANDRACQVDLQMITRCVRGSSFVPEFSPLSNPIIITNCWSLLSEMLNNDFLDDCVVYQPQRVLH